MADCVSVCACASLRCWVVWRGACCQHGVSAAADDDVGCCELVANNELELLHVVRLAFVKENWYYYCCRHLSAWPTRCALRLIMPSQRRVVMFYHCSLRSELLLHQFIFFFCTFCSKTKSARRPPVLCSGTVAPCLLALFIPQ